MTVFPRPTVSLDVTCAVVCTYGCDDGRIGPTRCAIIAAGLGFTAAFGDVGRGLVYPAPLCRGNTHCYTVSISHAGAPLPRLLVLHVPHRDRCCDAPPEPRDRDIPRPPPRSGTATTPLPGCGRPVAPAGMEHALAWPAGPAGSGGSRDRGVPGQTSGASAF